MLQLYANKGNEVPSELKDIKTKYNGNFHKYVEELLANSIYRSKETAKTGTQQDIIQLAQDPICNSPKCFSTVTATLLKNL